jgi:hypothetical protein
MLTEFKTTRWSTAEIAALKRAAAVRGISPSRLIRQVVLAEISDRVAA